MAGAKKKGPKGMRKGGKLKGMRGGGMAKKKGPMGFKKGGKMGMRSKKR
jgi:hypothetical protein